MLYNNKSQKDFKIPDKSKNERRANFHQYKYEKKVI